MVLNRRFSDGGIGDFIFENDVLRRTDFLARFPYVQKVSYQMNLEAEGTLERGYGPFERVGVRNVQEYLAKLLVDDFLAVKIYEERAKIFEKS